MQIELRTQVIEPRRKTFQYLADRYGDRPASRYEEGTVEVQPTEVFHYRPLWAPDRELYSPDWGSMRLADPYAFTDPRQLYYAPYVASRAQLYDGFARTMEYLEARGLLDRLPAGWQAVYADVVVPLRHYESGAQLVAVAGARFAWGTTVEQCCTFASFDRIANAQLVSRVGISLAGGSDSGLVAAKAAWMDAAHLQGARRLVEELLAEPTWDAGLVGLDLADRLLYPLLHTHLDEAALLGGAGAYSLVSQHMASWFADHRRWVDALLRAWAEDPEHGQANREALAEIAGRRLPQAAEAVGDVAAALDARVDVGAAAAVAAAEAKVRADLAALDVLLPPAAQGAAARPTTGPEVAR